ncbi:hypothetical protein CDAR_242511 [Caerostris darwini]|uniref:Uncharacterized protein n=1 Tax=Caerostris darwini TaxID=1538125 RepID=A0AAV4UNM3_9ARAC|nr:hypothetical protein CDAR_242511 [Caerostris darwini]
MKRTRREDPLRREDHLRTDSPPIKTDVHSEPVIEWQDRNPLCNVLNKMVSLVCVNSFTLRRENHLRTASPPIKTDVPPEPVIEWQDRNPLCNVLNKMVSLVCVNRCDLPPVHKSLSFPNFIPAPIKADPI